MPKQEKSLQDEAPKKLSIERPLTGGLAPYVLKGDYLMLIPHMPDHRDKLYAEIYSQPQVMQYFGAGLTLTLDEYTAAHLDRAKRNLTPEYNQDTGRLLRFTWTIITHDGIAGRLNFFPSEGRTEFVFCIVPTQQGRALARRANELAIAYMGEETPLIATAHPLNIASSKTLEQVQYPNGKFVFFEDPSRYDPGKYGKNQPRKYFLSQKQNAFSFFSLGKGTVHIDPSVDLNVPCVLK